MALRRGRGWLGLLLGLGRVGLGLVDLVVRVVLVVEGRRGACSCGRVGAGVALVLFLYLVLVLVVSDARCEYVLAVTVSVLGGEVGGFDWAIEVYIRDTTYWSSSSGRDEKEFPGG